MIKTILYILTIFYYCIYSANGCECFIEHEIKSHSIVKKDISIDFSDYLYNAALYELKHAKFELKDSKNGIIDTSWYDSDDQENLQFKVRIEIIGKLITSESLSITMLQRKKNAEDYTESTFSLVLEDRILRRARESYINEK